MLSKLFKKKDTKTSLNEIDINPRIKIGAHEIVNKLMAVTKNDKSGVHIESLLAIIGSLAGFSCQMYVREAFVKTGKITMKQAFLELMTEDGRKFYFGDLQNEGLVQAKCSIWTLTAGAAQSVGLKKLPDINEIFAYNSACAGQEHFGIPRLPKGHNISDMPINYIRHLWNPILPILNKFCDTPAQWPIILGLSAQNVIIMGKDVIDPFLALNIVMECAVPASKFDPVPLGIVV